jgi:tRNA threonylcarbamoyladenosine biosynthesis protein TsaB
LNILFFDAASSVCSAAIFADGVVIAKNQKLITNQHAEILVSMIEQILSDVKMDYSDLNLISTTIGPGSFTGIRIGLATARGLSLACNIPLIGVTNFEVLAYAVERIDRVGRRILVILETKRDDFYTCVYSEQLDLINGPMAIEGDALEKLSDPGRTIVLGDGVKRALPFFPCSGTTLIRQKTRKNIAFQVIADLVNDRFKLGAKLEKPAPMYINPPNIN